MTYDEWKNHIEKEGFYKVYETPTEIIVKNNDASIIFEKETKMYTASGFGSPLAFTTYSIYENWRAMIKAWLNERREKKNELNR